MHSKRRGSIGPRVWVWGIDGLKLVHVWVEASVEIDVGLDLGWRLLTLRSDISVWRVSMMLDWFFDLGVERLNLLVDCLGETRVGRIFERLGVAGWEFVEVFACLECCGEEGGGLVILRCCEPVFLEGYLRGDVPRRCRLRLRFL